jgi:hypothetical protein
MNRSTMMIMRIEESAIVLSLLKSDLRPMEDVLSEFDSKFESARYLSVCNSLSMMLQDQQMFKNTERLIAFGIIYQCYSSQKPSFNPFLSEMISAACNEQLEKSERAFLLHLLQWNSYNNVKEVGYSCLPASFLLIHENSKFMHKYVMQFPFHIYSLRLLISLNLFAGLIYFCHN